MTTLAESTTAALDQELEQYRQGRRAMFYPKTDLPVGDDVLRALRRNDAEQLRALALTVGEACRRALPAAPVSVTPLAQQGTFHKLFAAELADGVEVVIRVGALGPQVRDFQMLVEAWVADIVRGRGLPVPQVYHVDVRREHAPFDFAVVERGRGTALSVFDDYEERTRMLLREVGRLLAQVHSIQGDGYGFIDAAPAVQRGDSMRTLSGLCDVWSDYLVLKLAEHLDRCVALGAISAQEAKRIEALFAALKNTCDDAPAALLHGDPGSHNFLVDDGRISAILDWEDAQLGDPVFDVANWATFHPERRHAVFLDGYASVAPLSADFEVRFWLYYLRIALSKTVHRARFGYTDRPDRPAAAKRIETGLKRLEAALGS